MALYTHTFDQYEFLKGNLVTIRLTIDPYQGVVVAFTGEFKLLDATSPLGADGIQFDYLLQYIPDEITGDLTETAFTDILGNIVLGWLEKNFEDNGNEFGGVVTIHAPVSDDEVPGEAPPDETAAVSS